MTSAPNGRLVRTAAGSDLVLTRTFRAPIEDVWASVTESDRTARWFGPWTGEAAPGRTIKVQMAYENEAPWMEMRVDVCEPPRRLALSRRDESGDFYVEVVLSERDGVTELSFLHRLPNEDGVGEYGPGWEFYLDMLVAARDGTPRPSFDDYYPSMKPYYERLRADQP